MNWVISSWETDDNHYQIEAETNGTFQLWFFEGDYLDDLGLFARLDDAKAAAEYHSKRPKPIGGEA
jgi:hypothetical protein